MNLKALKEATKGNTRTTGISQFSELVISQVYPNPAQPRKSFENIKELAQSIKDNGLIQPISVVKKENGYMISAEKNFMFLSMTVHGTDINSGIEIKEFFIINNDDYFKRNDRMIDDFLTPWSK